MVKISNNLAPLQKNGSDLGIQLGFRYSETDDIKYPNDVNEHKVTTRWLKEPHTQLS